MGLNQKDPVAGIYNSNQTINSIWHEEVHYNVLGCLIKLLQNSNLLQAVNDKSRGEE